MSAGRGSSQSCCTVESSLTRTLPCMVTVETNPKGSYRLLTVECVPLCVNGFSSLDTLKQSILRFQLTSRLRWRGSGSALKSKSLSSFARSSDGKASMTIALLEATL